MKNSWRNGAVIALALTWDGARWPVRTLPPEARVFLGSSKSVIPSTRKMAKFFAEDQIREIRICWVSRLKGGPEVLSDPFRIPAAMRIGFRATRTVRFGDILGVVYRRG